ncbi:MAG: ECF transporter S component [Lachnospiraceae bacterium]|nr:ECF transporter S component [Lachnospiraceae bacterium]
MKTNVKKLTIAALMLAVCIASMFLKNTSVFITGPIVNTCLMLTAISCGLGYGLILSAVTPVLSFFITGSPVIAAIPLMMVMIAIGNAILVFFVWLCAVRLHRPKNRNVRIVAGGVIGSCVKAAFMWASISHWLLPMYLPEKLQKMLPVLQAQFSTTQLITALIGTVLTVIIWQALKRAGTLPEE